MFDKLQNILNSMIDGMNARTAFGVGGVFASLALIQIVRRLFRQGVNSADYIWLMVADVILAVIFFAAGMYIKSRKR